jgi:hypothetical protein
MSDTSIPSGLQTPVTNYATDGEQDIDDEAADATGDNLYAVKL